MSGTTVFVCSKCNKELKQGERDYCSKNNSTECAECRYLESIGVHTIAQYNEYLRKVQGG